MEKFVSLQLTKLVDLLDNCKDIVNIIVGYDNGQKAIKDDFMKQFKVIGGKKSNIISFPSPAANLDHSTEDNDAVCNAKSNEEDFDLKFTYGKGSITKRVKVVNNHEYEYYVGRFYFEGKQYEVGAKTQKECHEKMRVKKKELEKGEYIKRESNGLKVSDWLSRWFDLYKKQQNNAQSLAGYINRINAFFGDVALKNLQSEKLQEFINRFSDTPNTQKKIFEILNGSLNKAVAFRYIKYNPMLAVERRKYKPKKKRAFEFSEQNIFLSELPPKFAAAFFILSCTGLRIGEYLALSREDFNLVFLNIKIDKEIDTKTMKIKNRVKTDASYRNVPFTPELLKIADKIDPQKQYLNLTYDGFKKQVQRLLAKNTQIEEGLSIHSTRHTFASVCDFVGIRDKLIQSWLGHSTMAMTKDTYTHLINRGSSVILNYIKGLKEQMTP